MLKTRLTRLLHIVLLAVFVPVLQPVMCLSEPISVVNQASQTGCIQTFVAHDSKRKKDLQCRITYPLKSEASCPVIIFSHGALGSKDGYDYLANYWSQHGYVVIQPTHEDSMFSVPRLRRISFSRELTQRLPHDAALWDSRAHDISFIIDSLPDIEKQLPVRVDTEKVACGGHSLGAFTTALVAGAEPPPPATRKDYTDSRLRAFLLLSPQGIKHNADTFGFADEQAWHNMRGPALFMTGSKDNTTWTSDADRGAGFLHCPSGDKYFAVIAGAAHMTFAGVGNGAIVGFDDSGRSGSQPLRRYLASQLSKTMSVEDGDRKQMLNDICRITTCFLDAYLNHDNRSKAALTEPTSFDSLVQIKAR